MTVLYVFPNITQSFLCMITLTPSRDITHISTLVSVVSQTLRLTRNYQADKYFRLATRRFNLTEVSCVSTHE